MTKAIIVERIRRLVDAETFVERVVWLVPTPVPPSDHDFKYRLVLIRRGVRIVGYDNERGKGDHRHLHGVETAYMFVSLGTLLDDFEADVERET